MLKQFTAIFLLLALINCGSSSFMVYAGFEMNHKYITENLCVNKTRPWLHCNGRCYFMRKMKQAEQKERSAENQSHKYKFQDFVVVQKSNIRFYTQAADVAQLRYNMGQAR